MRFSYLLLLLLLVMACNDPSSVQDQTDDRIGEPAPLFTLTSLSGEEVSLEDQQGKVVYLFLYGANCPHCRSNGPVTQQIYEEFAGDTNFVALGLDTWNLSPSDNTSFRETTGIEYSLLLNARQVLINYYGTSSAYDRSIVINTKGRFAYKGTGFVNTDSNRVRNVIRQNLEAINP